jgi:ferredoxin
MRLAVDLNRCQGYAQCAFLAPEVFAMHGDESLVYDPQPEDEQRAKVARAVAACPVRAITAEGLEGADRAAGRAVRSGRSAQAVQPGQERSDGR